MQDQIDKIKLKAEALEWLDKLSPVKYMHATTCNLEDPESYGPCNCGASLANSQSDRVKKFITNLILNG